MNLDLPEIFFIKDTNNNDIYFPNDRYGYFEFYLNGQLCHFEECTFSSIEDGFEEIYFESIIKNSPFSKLSKKDYSFLFENLEKQINSVKENDNFTRLLMKFIDDSEITLGYVIKKDLNIVSEDGYETLKKIQRLILK